MANLGIKVETVLSKFYDVQQDENIKGLYAVRPILEPDGEIMWYFFNSNNATYHRPKKSTTSNVVIRDINQSNSAYIDRLKAAYEKAKKEDRKIFWLVLVYGEGIGLSPDGYDWMASVELRVGLDDITASLTMRKYPIGKNLEGYWSPCCKRVDQDKYFNTTFISCKDSNGEFTAQYMDKYFQIYDNRPYHDVVICDVSDEKDIEWEPEIVGERKTGAENILLYGVPGAGKSHEIKTKYCSDEKYMERVVFHPDYMYSDFVGQILPRVERDELGNDKLKYVFTPGPFTKMLKKAENDPGNYYYLVIEELNRGNAPAIFGEIFQLLDRKDEDEFPADEVGESEYGISNYDVAKEVYEDEAHPVRIPSNMYILATMNTADQNVFTLDTAFQRRWNMRQIENRFDKSEHSKDIIAGTKVNWGAFATVINDMVIDINADMASSEDKRLGTYFAKKKELEANRFPEKVLKYLWDDAFKMDKTAIFNENCKSLEEVVVTYETATSDKLAAVLRLSVYEKMLSKMQQSNTQNDEN